MEPGQGSHGGASTGAKTNISVGELKRVIELLPLEASAVNAVAPRLAILDSQQFASLLTELARDNHAFRHALRPFAFDGLNMMIETIIFDLNPRTENTAPAPALGIRL